MTMGPGYFDDPTVTVAVTVFEAVLMTETVPMYSFVAYTFVLSEVMARPVRPDPR